MAVYNPKGPAGSPHKTGATRLADRFPMQAGLYYVFGGPGISVRPLLPIEIWRSLGLEDWLWEQGGAFDQPGPVLAAGVRSVSRGQAKAFVTAGMQWLQRVEKTSSSAGMCVHPEEEIVQERLTRWLANWRENPDEPVILAATWWKAKRGRKYFRKFGRFVRW